MSPRPDPTAGARPVAIAHYVDEDPAGPPGGDRTSDLALQWHRIVRAEPLFEGHLQPRLPAELGFYDPHRRSTRDEQGRLARQHGIDAFCYRYRWENGRPTGVAADVVAHGSPEIQFCLAWSAEIRSGGLPGQPGPDGRHDERHVQFLLRAMCSPQYLRVGERPVLFVRSLEAARSRDLLPTWRAAWAREGLPDVHIVMFAAGNPADPSLAGADAGAAYLPECLSTTPLPPPPAAFSSNGRLIEYERLVDAQLARPRPPWTQYECVVPSWDETSRGRGEHDVLLHGSTPDLYGRWLRTVCDRAPANGLVLINAWNDWSSASYLEPDLTWGHAYLHATARATGRAGADLFGWSEIPAVARSMRVVEPARAHCYRRPVVQA
jgi:O-antigen biosynthesis protein